MAVLDRQTKDNRLQAGSRTRVQAECETQVKVPGPSNNYCCGKAVSDYRDSL